MSFSVWCNNSKPPDMFERWINLADWLRLPWWLTSHSYVLCYTVCKRTSDIRGWFQNVFQTSVKLSLTITTEIPQCIEFGLLGEPEVDSLDGMKILRAKSRFCPRNLPGYPVPVIYYGVSEHNCSGVPVIKADVYFWRRWAHIRRSSLTRMETTSTSS